MAKTPVRKHSVIRHNKTFDPKGEIKGETNYSRIEIIKRQREERALKKAKK